MVFNLPNKRFSGIVNLDNSRGAGTHWVANYHDTKQPFTEYMDSFGMNQNLSSHLKILKNPYFLD